MGDEILLALIGLGIVLGIPILTLIAFARTRTHRREIEDLRRELNSTLERVANLERRAAAAPAARPPEPASVVVPAVRVETVPEPAPPKPRAAEPQPERRPEPPPEPKAEPKTEPKAEPRPEQPQPAITPTPLESPVPATPNPVIAWLTRGNPVAKLGIVILFFGLAYLLRYVSEHGYLSIEVRLSGAAAIALGLLVVGWRLRHRSPVYALTLQGGSIGALYITSFAAFRIYGLIEHGIVFGLLIVICAASVALAVLQRAQSLALLASLGGYLAPVLLSTGGGNHVALFSYYALLSLGILAISVWQSWRPLNLIGFAFTFGIGAMWGASSYRPEHYASSQFFLILNLLIFGVAAVLTSLRRETSPPFIDGTLAFGSPLIGFGLQVGLTRHWEYGPAFSALAFGALYLPLAWITMRRWPERARLVTLTFLALGAGFVTLAIPLALSAKWTAMAWALEGLGVLWAGRGQKHEGMTWSGTGLLVIAGLAASNAWTDQRHVMDTATVIMMLGTLSLAWLAAGSLWRHKEDAPGNSALAGVFLAASVTVWILMLMDVSGRLTSGGRATGMLVLLALCASALGWHALGARLQWRPLAMSAFLLWPIAGMTLFMEIFRDGHPLGAGWWSAAWLAVVGTGWGLLRLNRGVESAALPTLHATYVWLLSGLAGVEVYWRLDRHPWGAEEWPAAGLLTLSALAILIVWTMAKRRHWALESFRRAYWLGALAPALATSAVVLAKANVLDGQLPGFPYIPLLNLLEEPALFALLMIAVWRRSVAALADDGQTGPTRVLLVGLLVWWANGVLLRTLATIGDVPWSFDYLWTSAFIQTSVAICWTAAALVAMALAARRRHRGVWFAGAAQLAAVVLKLFLVDSANTSGLARAVAFIGVAVLILVIGYLAPLPPRITVNEPAVPVGSEGGTGGGA